MKSLKIFSILLSFLTFFELSQASSNEGTVKASAIEGNVTLINKNTGIPVKLKEGRTFSQGYTVLTDKNASVLLLFSNGSTVNLFPDSSLSVTRFLQEPYNPALGTYTSLPIDPSRSNTLLTINYGVMTGRVKKLQPLSTYELQSVVGSAFIRGTTYRIEFQSDQEETNVMSVTNVDGEMEVKTNEPDTSLRPVTEGTAMKVISRQDPLDPIRRTVRVEYRNISLPETKRIYRKVAGRVAHLKFESTSHHHDGRYHFCK